MPSQIRAMYDYVVFGPVLLCCECEHEYMMHVVRGMAVVYVLRLAKGKILTGNGREILLHFASDKVVVESKVDNHNLFTTRSEREAERHKL